MAEFVTETLCKERRDSCQKACGEARETRDKEVTSLQNKIDNLILLAIGQLCALVLTLIGVIVVLIGGS